LTTTVLRDDSMAIVDRLLSLLRYGEENAVGVTEKRKIHHVNTVVLIAIAAYTTYVFIYLAFSRGNVVLINSAIVVAVFIPPVLLTPILNKRRRLRLARWVIALNYPAVVLSLIVFGQGNQLNAHFYFLVFSTIHFPFFPLSQRFDVAFFFLLNLSLFIINHLGLIAPYPEVHLLSSSFTIGFGIWNIVLSFLILGGMFYLSEYMSSRSDDELEALSKTDSLTGLLNRHGFMTRFEEECSRCQRSDTVGALLFFDLNKFKALNDERGHDAGDFLLQEIARRLEDSLRKTDVVARIGGDEFVALMCPAGKADSDALAQAKATAEKVRGRLSEPCILRFGKSVIEYACSSSIGVATFDASSNREEILRRADQAMYRDKNESKRLDGATASADASA
jgi:diguanylate cyclase (GGDEF)-like protein